MGATDYTRGKKPWHSENQRQFVSFVECAQAISTADYLQLFGTTPAITSGEFGTSSFNPGYDIAADGDGVAYIWRIPQDCELDGQNYKIEIYPICILAATVTAGDSANWTATYKSLDSDSTSTLVIPIDTDGIADGTLTAVTASAWHRAATPITLTLSTATTIVEGTTEALALNIVCDDINNGGAGFATNEQHLLGFDIVYNVPV